MQTKKPPLISIKVTSADVAQFHAQTADDLTRLFISGKSKVDAYCNEHPRIAALIQQKFDQFQSTKPSKFQLSFLKSLATDLGCQASDCLFRAVAANIILSKTPHRLAPILISKYPNRADRVLLLHLSGSIKRDTAYYKFVKMFKAVAQSKVLTEYLENTDGPDVSYSVHKVSKAIRCTLTDRSGLDEQLKVVAPNNLVAATIPCLLNRVALGRIAYSDQSAFSLAGVSRSFGTSPSRTKKLLTGAKFTLVPGTHYRRDKALQISINGEKSVVSVEYTKPAGSIRLPLRTSVIIAPDDENLFYYGDAADVVLNYETRPKAEPEFEPMPPTANEVVGYFKRSPVTTKAAPSDISKQPDSEELRLAIAETKVEGFVLDDEPLTPEQDAARERNRIYNSDLARVDRLRNNTWKLGQLFEMAVAS